MKTQNFKFGEAVKTLALQAGMRPYTFSKADEEREKVWKEYAAIYSDYVNFFQKELDLVKPEFTVIQKELLLNNIVDEKASLRLN